MTAYSNLEYLPAAIESVLAQDLDSYELILVDDGSQGDLDSVIAPFLERLRLIRQNNSGPGIARDSGVAAARGDYVAFCDSDDRQYPWRLSSQLAILESYPDAALVFSDLATFEDGRITAESTLRERQLGIDRGDFEVSVARAFGEPTTCGELGISVPTQYADRPVYSGKVASLIASRHIAWVGASMVRRSAYLDVGGHQNKLSYMEDWHLISRIAKSYDLVFWDAPVLDYRQHPGQQTKQDIKTMVRSYRDVVVDVWKDDDSLRKQHPALYRSLIFSAYTQNVHYAMEAGEFDRAKADILACIRALPWKRHGYTQLARCLWREAAFGNRSRAERASNPSGTSRGVRRLRMVSVGATAVLAVVALGLVFYDRFGPSAGIRPAEITAGEISTVSAEGEYAANIVEPVFALWDRGEIAGAFERSEVIVAELDDYEPQVQSLLTDYIIHFYLALGRVGDAEALAATVVDQSLRTELDAAIAFANGDMPRVRNLLQREIVVSKPSTALLMVMVGMQDAASQSIRDFPELRNAAQKRDVITALSAMKSGDTALAKQYFERASGNLDVFDEGFFYVATDMLAGLTKSEGSLTDAIHILEKTAPRQDVAVRNGSAIFWLMCQRNLADMYAESGQFEEASAIEESISLKLVLADDSFPLAQSPADV